MEESSSSSSPSSSQSTNTYTNPNPNPNNSNSSPPPPTQNTNSTRSRRSRYSTLLSTFRFLQAPLSTILSHYFPATALNPNPSHADAAEVSIRIVPGQERNQADHELGLAHSSGSAEIDSLQDDRSYVSGSAASGNGNADSNSVPAGAAAPRTPNQQRYDLQHAARLIEQIIPFSLLLMLVFIRQHLQGNHFLLVVFLNVSCSCSRLLLTLAWSRVYDSILILSVSTVCMTWKRYIWTIKLEQYLGIGSGYVFVASCKHSYGFSLYIDDFSHILPVSC